MIVIDVGCARYDTSYSIERLIDEFHPDILYGFDPEPVNPVPDNAKVFEAAAWTRDGEVGYIRNTTESAVTENGGDLKLCIDLARFIRELPDDEIVLKIDAEGSEYDLLDHLIAAGVDRRLTLALVEWHEPQDRRAAIEQRLGCELREWPW